MSFLIHLLASAVLAWSVGAGHLGGGLLAALAGVVLTTVLGL